jgi:copper chaperone CopZ
MTKTYDIKGMGCSHCVEKVEVALKSLAHVKEARVTLDPPQAVVITDGPVDDSEVQTVLGLAGHYGLQGEPGKTKHA